MLETTLKNLGLPEKASKLYLALLPLGPQPVRKIATAANLNRGTTYDILKILIQAGLVSYYHQNKHQYFIAENPRRLLTIIAERQHSLMDLTKEVQQLLPMLTGLKEQNRQPMVRSFEGTAGVKQILEDVLSTVGRQKNKLYYVYASPTIGQHLYQAWPEFIATRIKKKINVQVISLGSGGNLYGLDERRWISTNNSPIPTYTIIYDSKMAMISLDSAGSLVGLIIQHQGLVKTQETVFQTLWQILP